MKSILTAIFGRTFGIIWLYIGLGLILALAYPTLERLGWNQAAVMALLIGIVGIELTRAAKNTRDRSAKGSTLMDKLVASKTKAADPAPAPPPAAAAGTTSTMIDQTSLSVHDFDRAKAFYDAALAPLGYGILTGPAPDPPSAPRAAGYGRTRPQFWIIEGPAQVPPVHIAVTADTPVQVTAFHSAAIAAGGTGTAPPRAHPHAHSAAVRDPDGNIIEAVCLALDHT